MFVLAGYIPDTKIVKDVIELNEHGYIVTDSEQRTSIDGVYAVGDVRTKALRQVITAASDGAVAVHFAEEYLATIK